MQMLLFRPSLRIAAIFFLLCASAALPLSFLQAQSVRSYESELELSELEKAIERVLKKADKGRYAAEEETLGFSQRYTNGWFSAFCYDIYVGKIFAARKQTLVRIEGDPGDVDTLARVLELEGVIKKGSTGPRSAAAELYQLDDKSYIFSQGLNVLSPALSIIYQSYQSPRLRTSQAVGRALGYLFLDILAYWIGGARFFTTRHKPAANRMYIMWWWGINRAFGAGQAFNIVRGHNHLIQFGYSFPY